MKSVIVCVCLFVTACLPAFSQSTAYYKAIQKDSTTKIEPKQFKQLEEGALKDYAQPDRYEQLATAFASTSERVWAVIYGEVFCNLSSDPARSAKMGTLVYRSYEKSIARSGENLSVSLTENAEIRRAQPPFESQFEIAFLMGVLPLGDDVTPLSIEKLTKIRANQLSLWAEKKIPLTDLVRHEQAISAAGHFDAYNYWLFQDARPDEFNAWVAQHTAEYKAWQDWQSANKFTLLSADVQRLRLM